VSLAAPRNNSPLESELTGGCSFYAYKERARGDLVAAGPVITRHALARSRATATTLVARRESPMAACLFVRLLVPCHGEQFWLPTRFMEEISGPA
jgi:hypothetical protein